MNSKATIESVLFAAGEPVALADLAALLSIGKPELRNLLESLAQDYADRGIRLVYDNRQAQLVTAPEAAPQLSRWHQAELRGKLSASALETLAIIAYQGPATRPQIENVRGVQSAAAVRTLTIRGLITDVGRAKTPGRPVLYDVTLDLYRHLGVAGKADLPPVPEELAKKLSQAEPAAA